jgi:hypothetical protein
MAVRVEQLGGTPIAARGATHAQVNAPGRQGVEHTELFSNFERRIVRQHDPCRPQTNARGGAQQWRP